MRLQHRQRHFMPGFGISLGYTVFYLSLLVLIPMSVLGLKAFSLDGKVYLDILRDPRTLAAFKLTFGAAFAGAGINLVFGFIVAWTLVRHPFPGRRMVDALVDLPFALPTAVSGIALTTLFARTGLIGRVLEPLGIQIAFAPAGVIVALTFIGLPFIVRTLQPALEDLDPEYEEASLSLGASRLRTFLTVIFPSLRPALLSGFALAFARALGEYGSVVFISGNMPMRTEIVSLLIMGKLEQFDYDGATALAVMTLLLSFMILLLLNLLQWRLGRRTQQGG
ncbi:MAG: Sulfate transport system permease protein CysT [Candidatus Hydrogenedentes bacterium ADurb.Bin101]|jgi:sulfate transport system permease protein|nr:MAG: Sulfate transport system permease protein CysT [Candidatus Hydrogenedentes bacterium ADurb.Bin101]HOC67704.1 sulfate ABC transporter permease subunit CysT [Candidatus Hydrogenedentota bacterium]